MRNGAPVAGLPNTLSSLEDLHLEHAAAELARAKAHPAHITEYNGIDALKHVPAEHLARITELVNVHTAAEFKSVSN